MSSSKLRATEKVNYVAQTTFTIDRKYTELKAVGKGSYGVVCSALDNNTGKKVAIKKITPMAKHSMDAKHVLREIRLMRHMGKHENVIGLQDLIVREAADELYIIMELMDTDLHRVIQSKQALTEAHLKHFLFQLLCGVKYLHMNRIIHRDLKPGNLLVTRDCKLRITDFGLARERPTGKGTDPDDEIDEPMTEHVVTRWFRPPELMLCPDGLYDYSVDIWSCGCILGEMLGRKAMFPGKNFVHQLQLIFDALGSPEPRQVRHITNQQARKFLDAQLTKKKVPFQDLYPKASTDAITLLDAMLMFDPNDRATADEALHSAWFTGIVGCGSASEIYPHVSPLFEFNFERSHATKAELKQLIVQEASSFKKEAFGGSQTGASNSNILKTSSSRSSEQNGGGGSDNRSVGSASIGNASNGTGGKTERRYSSTAATSSAKVQAQSQAQQRGGADIPRSASLGGLRNATSGSKSASTSGAAGAAIRATSTGQSTAGAPVITGASAAINASKKKPSSVLVDSTGEEDTEESKGSGTYGRTDERTDGRTESRPTWRKESNTSYCIAAAKEVSTGFRGAESKKKQRSDDDDDDLAKYFQRASMHNSATVVGGGSTASEKAEAGAAAAAVDFGGSDNEGGEEDDAKDDGDEEDSNNGLRPQTSPIRRTNASSGGGMSSPMNKKALIAATVMASPKAKGRKPLFTSLGDFDLDSDAGDKDDGGRAGVGTAAAGGAVSASSPGNNRAESRRQTTQSQLSPFRKKAYSGTLAENDSDDDGSRSEEQPVRAAASPLRNNSSGTGKSYGTGAGVTGNGILSPKKSLYRSSGESSTAADRTAHTESRLLAAVLSEAKSDAGSTVVLAESNGGGGNKDKDAILERIEKMEKMFSASGSSSTQRVTNNAASRPTSASATAKVAPLYTSLGNSASRRFARANDDDRDSDSSDDEDDDGGDDDGDDDEEDSRARRTNAATAAIQYANGITANSSAIHRANDRDTTRAGLDGKKYTVAKSPKFSKMSWQRRVDEESGSGAPAVAGGKNRDRDQNSSYDYIRMLDKERERERERLRELERELAAEERERERELRDRTHAQQKFAKPVNDSSKPVPSYLRATASSSSKANPTGMATTYLREQRRDSVGAGGAGAANTAYVGVGEEGGHQRAANGGRSGSAMRGGGGGGMSSTAAAAAVYGGPAMKIPVAGRSLPVDSRAAYRGK